MFELNYNIDNFLVFPIDSRNIAVADKCLQKSIKSYLEFYFKRILENASSTSPIFHVEIKLTSFLSQQLESINPEETTKLINFTFAAYIILSLFELCVFRNKINMGFFGCLDKVSFSNFDELLERIAGNIGADIPSLQEHLGHFSKENNVLLLNKVVVNCGPNRHGNKYSPYEPLINNINDLLGCLAIQQNKNMLGDILTQKSTTQCCMFPLIRRPVVSKENFVKYAPNETSSLALSIN